MFVAQETVVCALRTGDILFFRAQIAIQVTSLKGHQQKELEYFKSSTLLNKGFAFQLAAVFTDTTAK